MTSRAFLPVATLALAGAVGAGAFVPNARADSPSAEKHAAKPGAAAPTRDVNAILADNVKALGGAAALGKHHNMHVVRTVSIKGMGIEGREERYATSTDKFLSTMTIPGVGVMRQGSDGKGYWAEDPINGVRLLEGSEKEQATLDGRWNAELDLVKLYESVKGVAAPDNAPKDQPLECLELVPKLGKPTTVCFDATTHHRVFQTGRQASPQGEVPFEARFSAWKSFDGVFLPTLEETTAGPASIEARVQSVKFDEMLDPTMFKLKTGKHDKVGKTDKTAKAAKASKAPAAQEADKAP